MTSKTPTAPYMIVSSSPLPSRWEYIWSSAGEGRTGRIHWARRQALVSQPRWAQPPERTPLERGQCPRQSLLWGQWLKDWPPPSYQEERDKTLLKVIHFTFNPNPHNLVLFLSDCFPLSTKLGVSGPLLLQSKHWWPKKSNPWHAEYKPARIEVFTSH